MKNIRVFYLKIFSFWRWNFLYLNRRVFVMITEYVQSLSVVVFLFCFVFVFFFVCLFCFFFVFVLFFVFLFFFVFLIDSPLITIYS